MEKDKEQIAMDVLNEALERCKRNNPALFADCPTVTRHNLAEVMEYLKGE